MFKKCLPIVLSALLMLSACGPAPQEAAADAPAQEEQTDGLSITATTYPVYLFTSEVTKEVPDVTVTLMVDQPISCLHDYTLSVNDMKVLEDSDVIVLSGAGLEATMADALDSVGDTPQIDCSQNVALKEAASFHHHDDHDGHDAEEAEHEHEHEGEDAALSHSDPHIWMDPYRASQMIQTIAQELGTIDPDHAKTYTANAQAAQTELSQAFTQMKDSLSDLSCREMITFHDGFEYFAEAFDLTILRSIEEEAGSEASAQEVGHILEEVEAHHLPAIFTEKNGATATADTIHRESGVAVGQLSLIMSGDTSAPGIASYIQAMQDNVNAIREAYS